MSAVPERVQRYNVSGSGCAPNESGAWCRTTDVALLESRLREVEAEAREADILLAGQIRELTRLRAERDALVPFAKHGLHLAANWYAPHFAARAVLDRLDREAK